MSRTRARWPIGILAATMAAGLLTSAPAFAVSGGGTVPAGTYDFVTKIEVGDERACTGALIDPHWVVTANDCFSSDPSQDNTVPAGPPRVSTTATIGSTQAGPTVEVVELVPRTDRNLVLARLATGVTDVEPIEIATSAPTTGDVLRSAGFGRTATTWVPDQAHTATFSVETVNELGFSVLGTSEDSSICKGDAGGPLFRVENTEVTLVGINDRSWQHGCLGETTTQRGATATRVGDLTGWVEQQIIDHAIVSHYGDQTPEFQAAMGEPTGEQVVVSDSLRYRDYEGARIYWTPEYGAKIVFGAILDKFLAQGGHKAVGVPTTDELIADDGVGRYNEFIDRTSGTESAIYWTPETTAHVIRGEILSHWRELGAEANLGYPTTDTDWTPDETGRFNHFALPSGGKASIYWTSSTGANAIRGEIRSKWASTGWERGPLGYPASDEVVAEDGFGRYNLFTDSNGMIVWSHTTGAHMVLGEIAEQYRHLQGVNGVMGYPITDELASPDGRGRYSHFNGAGGGAIYWTATTGAHEMYGGIWDRWSQLGWERSYLGYPTSGEYSVAVGRRNDFEGGTITYNSTTGQVTDQPW